jgi:hypothetical protein
MSGAMNIAAKQPLWQDPSKFSISIVGAGAGILGLPGPDVLSMACQGIGLAELNTSPIEDWVGEEWRFATGRLENYQISITFKDFDNFTLYKSFANAMQEFSRMYPDDQKIDILIQTSDDFAVTGMGGTVDFKDCMLISVSGATLDNSAIASVAEFTVTLKCSYVTTY